MVGEAVGEGSGISPGEAYFRAGAAAQSAGRMARAEREYGLALAHDCGDHRVWANLGLLYLRTGRAEAAASALGRSANMGGGALALAWLGEARKELLQLDEAAGAFARSLELDPNQPRIHFNLGRVQNDLGRFDEALDSFDRALALDPAFDEVRWPRCLALFRKGALPEAFAGYEARFRRDDCPPREFTQPRWDGRDLDGATILLHHEQGLGDTIMFSRYAKLVAGRGGRVLLGCQKELAGLMSGVEGVSGVVVSGDKARFDYHLPMMSLPLVMGTELETIPAPRAYVPMPKGAQPRLRRPRGTRLAVGIVWAGNPKHSNDRYRSASLAHFMRLAEVPGVVLYSLQYGARSADIAGLGLESVVVDLGRAAGPFPAKAAAMAALDLVVCVDTAEAHLAGALGRPVWTLLPYNPDWRWMWQGADCPWYPTMRLYRQDRPGCWDGVFEAVAGDLGAALASGDLPVSPD